MLGSIFIGLSGMNAYSRGLRTISNNVANLNTPGFKASAVTFADQFNLGGVGSNFYSGSSRHLGSGVRLSDPALDFTQGDLRTTGRDLDLAVQGDGFMVLLDGDQTSYARTGQFVVDEDGYVVHSGNGGRLAVLDASGTPTALNVEQNRVLAPEATTRVSITGMLNTSNATQSINTVTVYDSLGASHTWSIEFEAVGASSPGVWTVTVSDGDTEIGTGEVRFDTAGNLDPTTSSVEIVREVAGAEDLSVTVDFPVGRLRSLSGGSGLTADVEDGRSIGTLQSVSIDDDGSVQYTYSNGETRDGGRIALAGFRDPRGLEQAGDGIFRARDVEAFFHASGENGGGKLVSGRLEASNVDLAQQFGELILVQRGFQASSQVVSVSNDMIQQLFGIRGQG